MFDWSQVGAPDSLSRPDRISIKIERLMLDGQLREGDRLPPERELAEIFSASRVSVRQALRELEIRGLVDRRPGRGTTVVSRSSGKGTAVSQLQDRLVKLEPEAAQIMEFRSVVEPPMAALAAERATPRDIAQLEDLLASMQGEISKERYFELDASFHQAIALSTYNPLLVALGDRLARDIAPVRQSRMQSDDRLLHSRQEHEAILAAIKEHDCERAEAAARLHIESISTEIMRQLSDAGA